MSQTPPRSIRSGVAARRLNAARNGLYYLSIIGMVVCAVLSALTFVEVDNTLLLGAIPLAPWLFLASAVVFAGLQNKVLLVAITIAAVGVVTVASPGSASPSAECSVARNNSGGTVLYSHNVLFGTADPELVVAQAADAGADIILFQEATADFIERVSPLLDRHPHVVIDGYQAVFSRHEVSSNGRSFGSPDVLGLLDTTIEAPEGELRLINVHATPPHIPDGRDTQIEQFAFLADALDVDNSSIPTIAMGDFNATPFDTRYRSLVDDDVTDAHDAVGCGLGVTWSPTAGLGPALLGLDHALTTGVEVEAFEIYDYAKSDHKGIAVLVQP